MDPTASGTASSGCQAPNDWGRTVTRLPLFSDPPTSSHLLDPLCGQGQNYGAVGPHSADGDGISEGVTLCPVHGWCSVTRSSPHHDCCWVEGSARGWLDGPRAGGRSSGGQGRSCFWMWATHGVERACPGPSQQPCLSRAPQGPPPLELGGLPRRAAWRPPGCPGLQGLRGHCRIHWEAQGGRPALGV